MSLIKKEISLPLGMSIEHTGTVMELFAKLSIIFLNSGRTGGLKLKKKNLLATTGSTLHASK